MAQTAQAQTQDSPPLDITASPTSFDLKVLPGTSITKQIRVHNNNAKPVTLTVSVKKLIADPNGSISMTDFKDENFQNWLTVQTASVSASPKEWVNIPFTVAVPQEAAFGYYWAILVSLESPQKEITAPQAQITGALAVPVLLAVDRPDATFEGKLSKFQTSSKFSEYVPITFQTTFDNLSNVHIKPQGDIFVSDWLGRQVAVLPANEAQGSILPGSKRTYEVKWDDSFISLEDKMEDGKVITDKNGQPVKEYKFRFDKLLNFRIGKYTATTLLVISSDTKDLSYQATTDFWVIPWKILIGVILFVVLAGVGLLNTVKSIIKAIKKFAEKFKKNDASDLEAQH